MEFCSCCDRFFGNENALRRHKAISNSHGICNVCGLSFKSWRALVNHWTSSPVHDYCKVCDEHFDHEEELEEHYQNWHYYCGLCRQFFKSDESVDDHNESSHPKKTRKQKTRKHCPGRRCLKSFDTYAGLTQHLESGACASRANRAMINSIAVKLDTNRVITNADRLLSSLDSFSSFPLITQSYATEKSFNGSAYQCVLCRKIFKTLDRLNQHLNSPAHDAEIYQCPKRYGGCGTDFKVLSALMQHVESGACNIHRYQAHVDRALDNITAGIGMIGLK